MTPSKYVFGLAIIGAGLLLLHCRSVDGAANSPTDGGTVAVGDATPDSNSDIADTGAPADAGSTTARDIPTSLTGWGLFTGAPDAKGHLTPVSGTVPYELTTALFSDYALKSRTITIPPGASAGYEPETVLDFPVGTVISKTFAFPADLRQPEVAVKLIETRILIHQPTGWEGYPYLWNDAQTEATLAPGGRLVPMSLVDLEGSTRDFNYLVPSRNQCLQCHHLLDDQNNQVMHPIGPKARYLNRNNVIAGVDQNQLTYLAAAGLLTGLPADPPQAPNAFDTAQGDVNLRARTYLDINCAHCHNPRGTAGQTSHLFLQHDNTDPFSFGVCKRPGSAGAGQGGEFDVVPGDSAHSILWNRIHTTESGKMMPQIGRTLLHDEGTQLVADWIDGLPAETCQ